MLSFMYYLGLSFFIILFPVQSQSSSNFTIQKTTDALLRDLASKALLQHRPHTGALYKARVPTNLSGMEVSVVRLRSKNLWSRGTNASYYITIPTKTLPKPYVRRVLVVYQDFGNLSSYYYEVPGYVLLSSVVGFTAYDASNVSSNSVVQVSLNATEEKPMEIRFPRLTVRGDGTRRRKCVKFDVDGRFRISEMTNEENVCYSRNEGFFSIVARLEKKKKKSRVWGLVKGFLIGILGFVLLIGLVGIVLVKLVMGKKIDEMEREADEGVGLEIIWIGASKMPSATVTRTHPVLENASLL